VGCCSLKVKNIDFPEKNFIKLDFLGKDSIRYENTVELPEAVFNKLRLFHAGKNPDDLLFHLINTGRLNDYLKSMMSDLSAKVFRTYNASYTLQK
jgi:DNA topoisomerase-1